MKWRWVSKAVAESIHDLQISTHGGSHGLRDAGLLESALARPKNLALYEKPDVFDLAASYAFGIVKNHPFVDGNKRTALVVSATFLEKNGYVLIASESVAVTVLTQLASGKIDIEELAEWFEDNSEVL